MSKGNHVQRVGLAQNSPSIIKTKRERNKEGLYQVKGKGIPYYTDNTRDVTEHRSKVKNLDFF